MKLRIIFFTIASLMACSLHAQHSTISFEHFTNANGLSAPVHCIIQDKYGFLWLGTSDGLNRFDGKNFITYRNIPGNELSLSNNIINGLCADGTGRVWIATNDGLCYYNLIDNMFHRIAIDDTLEKIDRHRIYAIAPGKGNTIWFATRSMLHLYDNDKKPKTFLLPLNHDLNIRSLFVDDKNRVWIGANESIVFVFDPVTGKFIAGKITSAFSERKKISTTINPILPLTGDTLLIGSWYAGMQKIFISGDSVKSISFIDSDETDPRSNIVSGISCKQPYWWIGTYGNGIAWFDPHTGKFTDHFKHDPADAKSLSNDYINDIFTDASGIVWIGTSSGLDKFDPFTQQFKSVSIPAVSNEFSVYRLPSTIIEDSHNREWLWITVSGVGLFHYNTSTSEFKLYHHDPLNLKSLPDDNIYTVFYDEDGKMWIGSKSGAYFFDEQSGKITVPSFPGIEKLPGIHKIFRDKQKRYWFASFGNGVYCYNPAENKITLYQHEESNPNSLPDNKVFCMMEDYAGKIWIGTQNRGLCCLNPSTGKFIFFEHDKKEASSLPDNGVYDLFEDDQKNLWIATENGLAEMNPEDFKIKTYTTNNGLPNNDIFSITSDEQNQLWLGTNNGLSRMNPAALKEGSKDAFKNYFMGDGLPENHISGGVYCTQNGMMYFGTSGMISFCRPKNMKMNKRIPPVIITAFKIFDKPVTVIRNDENIQSIHLSYTQNMITFDFTALNFTNAGMNQYAYRLEGFDENWIQCGNKQSATYTNLDGGRYTFHVKASNNDGVWNEQGTSVVLFVSPPYWKTWWFYLLCISAIAAIFYFVYRIRVKQLIKLQQIRMGIARDLHDDIGSTLSSINMISSMADKNESAPKKSSELFKTISSASGQAMELMNDIVWSINPKNDRMEMMIIRMRQYASEILEAANISFSLSMDDACKEIILPVEKRKDFYLIFKEAINNLAKYSHAKNADINIKFVNKILILTIADNGNGFETSLPGSYNGGNGLKNMEARAGHLRGELTIASYPGKGTEVNLKIPITP